MPGYWCSSVCTNIAKHFASMKREDCKPRERREFEYTYHITTLSDWVWPLISPGPDGGVSAILRYDGQQVSSLYKRGKLIISRKQPGLSWADSLAFWWNNSFFTAAHWSKARSDAMRSRKTSRSEFSDALFKVALSPPGEDDLVLGGRALQRENDWLRLPTIRFLWQPRYKIQCHKIFIHPTQSYWEAGTWPMWIVMVSLKIEDAARSDRS